MRSLHSSLRDSLLTEEAFSYAHLVKFEKPVKTDGGKSARRAKDYTYLSDASIDLVFNDNSTDIRGNANGAQVYVANKLLRVGDVSESSEAKTSSMSLSLSSAALSTAFTDTLTFTSTSITTASTDFVEAGFREGDIIELLTASGGVNNTVRVRLNGFTNSNKTANTTPLSKVVNNKVTEISALGTDSPSVPYSVNFDSPEIESVLSNRSQATYARYLNRDVFVYKAHINIDTGAIIGAPYLLFKGIIAGGKIKEDPQKDSVVTWTLTSHWGDFQRVAGRLTSDTHHRALDSNGRPDLDSVIRPAYARDLGFLHAESAVNLVAVYQVMETRYKEKRRGGLAGFFGGKKLKEYEVEVDREADLRFNLDAKHLPVVYGVNKIDSIPFFVDTLDSNSKKIYVAYALCEGEIGGLYDVYFDDTSTICLDQSDSETRSTQPDSNTVDVICEGRMDRGDTLSPNSIGSGNSFTRNGFTNGYGVATWESISAEVAARIEQIEIPAGTFPGGASIQASGITHEKGRGYTTPIDTRLIFHSGKPDQKADALLVENSTNFKVGNDYYDGTADYWGPNHQVLDTAYVVCEYTISEGEVTIPSLDFVVRGKGVNCYNYDFSYEQDPLYTSADAATSAFDLGDTVDLKKTSDDSSLGTAVIADIFTLTNLDGTVENRIRFLEQPSLGHVGGIPTTTAFYMQAQGGSNQFHLVTYNNQANVGTVSEKASETVSSVSNNSNNTSIDLTLNSPSAAMQAALSFGGAITIHNQDFQENGQKHDMSMLSSYSYSYSGSGNTVTAVGATTSNSSTVVNRIVTIKDAIILGSNASNSDDAYNGRFIEVTRNFSDNTTKVQKRKIIDYNGGNKVAKVDSPFEEDAIPRSGDTYKILSRSDDVRVSINPAMQLLDYLMADRYGRDLTFNDIDISSFLQAARDCDTRSDVTILSTSTLVEDGGTLAIGDTYHFKPGSNKVKWVGTVKSVEDGPGSLKNVTFTDVSGKLVNRWYNWRSYSTGDLYYYKGGLHQAGSDGLISSTPSTTSSVSSLSLTKIGTSTTCSVFKTVSATAPALDGNPVVRKVLTSGDASSGYSLYDSDDVKYWRYLGWESNDQRNVTRHQTNPVINTSVPIFENVNSMLGHFNGILRYANGKYELAVKQAAAQPSPVTINGTSYTVESITDEDIIGDINVEDVGQKGTYNSVSVSIDDPQNRFESRAVTLFNSTYLKQDRMVPKKGDVRTPYINNYFNARINAKQYLDDSRAGLRVSFTMAPRGVLLRAGDIILLNYPRFGWSNKLYRITNLTFREDCLVQVNAEEHNDDGYLIQPDNPIEIKAIDSLNNANLGTIAPPTFKTSGGISQNERGGIVLVWDNTTAFNPAIFTVEIHRSTQNIRSTAKIVGTSKGDNFTDTITGTGSSTFYYWIRYSVLVPQQRTSGVAPRQVFSAFHPSGSGGVGISDGARDAISVNLTNDSVTIRANSSGVATGFDNSGITITAFIGSTQLNYDDTSAYDKPSFRISNVTSSGVTPGNAGNTSNSYTRQNITAMSADVGSIQYTIVVTDSLGASTTFVKEQTFTKSRDGLVGSNGVAGRSVVLTASDQSIEYDTAGANPSPSSVTLTATAFNTVNTPYYEFIKGTTSVQNTSSNTYSYTPPSSVSSMPETVTVKVREGSNSGTLVATDAISMIGLRQGRDAITILLSNQAHTLPSSSNGIVTSFTGSGTSIEVYQGTNQLTYDDSSPYANSTFRVSASGNNISPGSASTASNNKTRTFGNASNMTANAATITFTITVKGSDGVETTFSRLQSLSKSLAGSNGQPGATGPRTASAVLYYQSSSSTAPTAPTASSYNFSTGEFGSHTSGWDEDAPTFAAGNTNKYWYVRITVQETTYNGTQSITVGSVLQGIGFSGLVTFTSATTQLQQISNGSQSLSFGEQGTTTIDGGRITSGTIDAQRLNVGQINVTQTNNYSVIQQNIQDAEDAGVLSGQQASGQAAAAAAQASQAQQGVQTAQTAAAQAAAQASQAQTAAAQAVQTLPTQLSQLQNNIGAFTQPAQINVTQTNNYIAPPTNTNQLTNGAGFQTQAFTSAGQVNITQTQNYAAPPTQVGQLQNDEGYYNQPGQLNITQLTNYGDVTTAIQQADDAASQAQQDAGSAQTVAGQASTQAGQAQTVAGQAQTAAAQAAAQIPTQVGQLTNDSGFQTAAIEFSATAISGGKIGLSTTGLVIGNSGVSVTAQNAILLDTTSGNNAISIYDGSTLRVKIGKL